MPFIHDDPAPTPDNWAADSWRDCSTHAQAIVYDDENELKRMCDIIRALPPLVGETTIEEARTQFEKAARGDLFILQGGDCAESFNDVTVDKIGKQATLLGEQAAILEASLSKPVAVFGRIAGQYAKPRSNPWETQPDGTKIMAFRGHNVNGVEKHERTPDPYRLLLGHFHSSTTLKALSSLDQTVGVTAPKIYSSHEALHLPYESAVTRGRYNSSAAMVWLGERTRSLDGAHVEYLRGIANPIGVKVGKTMDPKELVELLQILMQGPVDAEGQARGRPVALITRLGAKEAATALPPLVRAVRDAGLQPTWLCDPCHANTQTVNGVKTRSVAVMLEEVRAVSRALADNGSHLGGLHIEQTGEKVTECLESIDSHDSPSLLQSESKMSVPSWPSYTTLCDPRLSREQALMFIAKAVTDVGETTKS